MREGQAQQKMRLLKRYLVVYTSIHVKVSAVAFYEEMGNLGVALG